MTRTIRIGAVLAAVLLLTVGCFSSAAPISSSNSIGTIVAATMNAISIQATATPMPVSVSPSTTTVPSLPTKPPIAPTPIPPSASRINFLSGATTGVVSGPIQPGQVLYYVLNASQGQPMIVMVTSLNNDVTLSVKTQGGTSMLNQATHQSSWQTMLPQTEDYYIGVYGGSTFENFTLSVEIPSRIKFDLGADTVKLSGETVAGYVVAYTVFALKDQKMTVNVNSQANSVVLTIYGYTDGQPYVRSASGKTSFILRLPSTQDYIIELVPKAGQDIPYDMQLIIK